MACADNVVRPELIPKLKDGSAIVKLITCAITKPDILGRAKGGDRDSTLYRAAAILLHVANGKGG